MTWKSQYMTLMSHTIYSVTWMSHTILVFFIFMLDILNIFLYIPITSTSKRFRTVIAEFLFYANSVFNNGQLSRFRKDSGYSLWCTGKELAYFFYQKPKELTMSKIKTQQKPVQKDLKEVSEILETLPTVVLIDILAQLKTYQSLKTQLLEIQL